MLKNKTEDRWAPGRGKNNQADGRYGAHVNKWNEVTTGINRSYMQDDCEKGRGKKYVEI